MNGIKFDDIHSYDDLNLVLAPFEMPPAEPKTNYVDLPGADGSIDMTEALGDVKYKDRIGKIIFSVLPEDNFEEKKTEVSNLLNGLKCKITLDKDEDFYYLARCSISDYKCNKMLRQIVVDVRAFPYKLKNKKTVMMVNSGEIDLINNRMPVVPEVIASANATIVFKGNVYTVNPGRHKILDFQLKQGANHFSISTVGTVTFEYQEGAL